MSGINTAWLETYLAVVAAGSIDEAAHQLDCEPSVVTEHLYELEIATKSTLMVAGEQPTMLTPEGYVLHHHATVALRELQLAVTRIQTSTKP